MSYSRGIDHYRVGEGEWPRSRLWPEKEKPAGRARRRVSGKAEQREERHGGRRKRGLSLGGLKPACRRSPLSPSPSLPQCLPPPYMLLVPSRFPYFSSPTLLISLYTAQESPTYRPAHPGPLPATFTYSPFRVFRYDQIRVRCPLTRHRSPS